MIKVLHYIPGFLVGGIESMYLEWYRHIDHNTIEFELLLRTQDDESIALKQYKQMNGIYYRLPKKSTLLAYDKAVKTFFKGHHDYDIVHCNDTDYIVQSQAKKYGIKVIVHSHTSSEQKTDGFLKNMLFSMDSSLALRRYTDYAFACSKLAAKWKFGGLQFHGKDVTIIHNAIDVKKYTYDADRRELKRNELGISDKFVIGHVGRLTYPKNQFFLLDIVKEVLKQKQETVLLMIGDGPDMEALKQHAAEIGITDSVCFMGNRNDVPDLMQAMDVFLLPSRYEGLGIVAIEAQAACLPTVCSIEVPDDTRITDLIQYISLDRKPKEWAKTVASTAIRGERYDTSMMISEHGYDMELEIVKLINYYEMIKSE